MVGPVVFFVAGFFSFVFHLFIDLFTKQEQNLKKSEKPYERLDYLRSSSV